jgi:hypothetical protein
MLLDQKFIPFYFNLSQMLILNNNFSNTAVI